MEEYDSEDFTLEEDEDFVLLDGEYRDEANELVKEDEEQTENQGEKWKAQGTAARRRKQGDFS